MQLPITFEHQRRTQGSSSVLNGSEDAINLLAIPPHPPQDNEKQTQPKHAKRIQTIQYLTASRASSCTGTVEYPGSVKPISARQRRFRDHVIRQVPFPKVCRRITALLKESRGERRVRIQPIQHPSPGIARHPGKVAVDTITNRKVPAMTAVRLGEQTPLATVNRWKSVPSAASQSMFGVFT